MSNCAHLRCLMVHFEELLCMLDMMHWWYFDVSNSVYMNIAKPIKQVLNIHTVQTLKDQCIVWTREIDYTVSIAQIWTNLAPRVSTQTNGESFTCNTLISTCASSQTSTPCQWCCRFICGTEWYSVMFSDENRFYIHAHLFLLDTDPHPLI